MNTARKPLAWKEPQDGFASAQHVHYSLYNGRWDCWKELHGLTSICQKIQRELPNFTGSSTGTFANNCFVMYA